MDATLSLDATRALAVVKRVSAATDLTVGAGARLPMPTKSARGTLAFVITSLNGRPLCEFSADAHDQDGGCRLRVGGIERCTYTQPRFLFYIPVGPKLVGGYGPYKSFLAEVRKELLANDPGATVTVDVPRPAARDPR